MAIVFATQKWRHYLLGQQFTVFTDQKSLKYLLDQRVVEEGQQWWLSKLLGYNFEIKYKASSDNRVADALSRKFHYSSISFSIAAEWADIETEVLEDVKLKNIMQKLLFGEEVAAGFELRNGKLMYRGRLVLAKNSK